jgi:hypothetical protein
MIRREQIEELNKSISEIASLYTQKVKVIIAQAENSGNSPAVLEPRDLQELRNIRQQLNCLFEIRDNCLQIIYKLEWLQDSFSLLN